MQIRNDIEISRLSKIKSPSENRHILSGGVVELDFVETDLKMKLGAPSEKKRENSQAAAAAAVATIVKC